MLLHGKVAKWQSCHIAMLLHGKVAKWQCCHIAMLSLSKVATGCHPIAACSTSEGIT